MRSPFRLVLAASLILGLGRSQAAADDLETLQGTWTLISMERDGEPGAADKIKGRVVRIEGDRFTGRNNEKVYGEGTLSLVGKGQPLAVDATFTAGLPKGKTSRGIYELDGDMLKACASEPEGERPSRFETRRDSRRMLVVYRRAKP